MTNRLFSLTEFFSILLAHICMGNEHCLQVLTFNRAPKVINSAFLEQAVRQAVLFLNAQINGKQTLCTKSALQSVHNFSSLGQAVESSASQSEVTAKLKSAANL